MKVLSSKSICPQRYRWNDQNRTGDIVAAHGEHLDRVEAIQPPLRGHQHEQASAARTQLLSRNRPTHRVLLDFTADHGTLAVLALHRKDQVRALPLVLDRDYT